MKRINLFLVSLIFLMLFTNCNSNSKTKNEEKTVEKEQISEPKIDKEFITLNSVQIGDNITQHPDYKHDEKQDNFFDIYINKEKTTINELEGNLKLFVSNSIIEKIEFNSGDSFFGSTSVAGTVFDAMLEQRKNWVRDAMLNYSITEWDDSRKKSQYVKKDFLHQYDLERIEMLGVQMGWNMSYVITSKDAEKKELQGKKSNLNFGSTKSKKEVIEENDEIISDKTKQKSENNILGLYPQASKRLLTIDDVSSLSKDDLSIMRNEVFARYGHKFNEGGKIEKYFTKQDWYNSQNIDATSLLTEIEKKNIEFIRSQEQQDNNQKLTISVDNLRVRKSPELDSEKIENLAIGSEVEFLEKSNNQTTVTIKNNEITEYWYKVKTPSGKIGWIHGCCFDK
ncbi:YARHG domain-containing protein [Lacinutrix sp. MEBiC02595]